MNFIIIFTILFGGTAFISILFKEKFENSVSFYILSVITLIYLFGLIGSLSVGFYLVVTFSISGILMFGVTILQNKTRKAMFENILTPGFFAFAAILFFIFLINRFKGFSQWDDFSHWGIMIKETLRLDTFYNVPASALSVHRNYPPAITLFQYFWCRLTGGFSELSALRSIQFFTLAMLLPVFFGAKHKNIVKNICLLILLILLPNIFIINIFETIYVDAALGVIAGYSLSIAIRNDRYSLFTAINFSLCCFVLILTKQMGIFFAGAMFICLLVRYRKLSDAKELVKGIASRNRESLVIAGTVSGGVLSIFLAQISWSVYLASVDVHSAQFKVSSISFSGILTILKGAASNDQITIIRNYMEALTSSSLSLTRLPMPYLQLMVLILAILIGLIYIISKINDAEKVRKPRKTKKTKVIKNSSITSLKNTKYYKSLVNIAIIFPFMAITYAIVMLLLYLFSFSPYEGVRLASYHRYMSTFWISIISLFFIFTSSFSEYESSSFIYLLITVVIAVFLIHPSIYNSMVRMQKVDSSFMWQQPHADKLMSAIDIERDKVYLIIQDSNGTEYWGIKYYANPLQTNRNFSWAIGNQGNTFTREMTDEEWANELIAENFDYVYLVKINDSFINEFGSLFSFEIAESVIYRVERGDENNVLLKAIP